MKRAVTMLLVLIMTLCGMNTLAEGETVISLRIGEPEMTVNGEKQAIDENGTVPVIVNDRTLLPVRAVVEAMGGNVAWNGVTRTVSLVMEATDIKLVIDDTTAYLDDKAHELDTAPAIINDRTMLPIRFIAEGFGFDVAWDEASKTITITGEAKTIEKKEDKVMLTYQGHGSVKFHTPEGKVVYVDPYAGEGYDEEADLILVTHEHPDHNKTDLMPHAADCVIFRSSDAIQNGEYQTLDIYGMHIEPVQAYNKNHKVEECVGYLVTVGGKLLYFAGDTSKTDQMATLSERGIDYAFLPMDGRFNMDIAEAIECAELIKAKHTIPYHMSPGALFDRERAEQFKTESAFIIEAGQEIEL